MDEQKQDDPLEPTYNSFVPIRDISLKTCLKQWTKEKGGGRGSGISVLMARCDGDDNNDSLDQLCLFFLCRDVCNLLTFAHRLEVLAVPVLAEIVTHLRIEQNCRCLTIPSVWLDLKSKIVYIISGSFFFQTHIVYLFVRRILKNFPFALSWQYNTETLHVKRIGLVFLFNGISTFVGYFMPKPFS